MTLERDERALVRGLMRHKLRVLTQLLGIGGKIVQQYPTDGRRRQTLLALVLQRLGELCISGNEARDGRIEGRCLVAHEESAAVCERAAEARRWNETPDLYPHLMHAALMGGRSELAELIQGVVKIHRSRLQKA